MITVYLHRHHIRQCSLKYIIMMAQASALGGPAVLQFLSRGVLVVAGEDNETCMQADAAALGVQGRVVLARSYAEAAGLLAAHKAGILFESLTSTVSPVIVTDLNPH